MSVINITLLNVEHFKKQSIAPGMFVHHAIPQPFLDFIFFFFF